jgi:signal transduction histidine kinase
MELPMQVLSAGRWFRGGPRRYIIAMVLTAVFLVVRGALDPSIGNYVPYLAVLPAVILSAWFGGLGPSIVATLLAFVGEQYWFIPPVRTLRLENEAQVTGTVVYFVVSGTIILFAEMNRRTLAKLTSSQQRLKLANEELAKAQDELEMRVRERTWQLGQKNQELANQTEMVRNLSGQLLQSQDDERRRIARELHDDINQRLALLAVNLDRLKQDIPGSAEEAQKGAVEATKQVQDLGSDVQALSHRLHSSKLEYLGLAVAAAGFCREISDRQQMEIDFQAENIPKELSDEISLCLFRVLQEAVQNGAKHSGSRHLQVSLSVASNEIQLTVRDSGIGFDPDRAVKGRGIGLTSMKERLKLVNGEISIDSQLQRGTTIRARVPLASRTKAAGAAQ